MSKLPGEGGRLAWVGLKKRIPGAEMKNTVFSRYLLDVLFFQLCLYFQGYRENPDKKYNNSLTLT